MPQLRYWHLLILSILIVMNIANLVKKKLSGETAVKLNLIVLTIFGGLSLINIFTKIPTIVETMKLGHQTTTSEMSSIDNTVTAAHESLPNFYYFIFDEFGGYDSVKRYCDYDSQPFYDELKNAGFSVSMKSANPTIDTYTELPNLLQLSKVNLPSLPAVQKKENALNPRFFQLMMSLGYKINIIDSHPFFLDAKMADYMFTSSKESSYGKFDSLIISNTLLFPFYGRNDIDYEADLILSKFAYAKESSSIMSKGLLTVGYFNFPHLPFVFTEDGKITQDKNRLDVSDSNNYLAQYKFAMTKIMDLVTYITANNPNAIIVLQSDHGFRYPNLLFDWYGDDRYNLEDEFYYQRNILNAVLLPHRKLVIEGLDGVETLKKVLTETYNVSFKDD